MSDLSGALVAFASLVMLALGLAHLAFTFVGTRLHPRDSSLEEQLKTSFPQLTRRTTMWRAWVGFNASHSMGAVLFGLVYGYLALAEGPMLFASSYLIAVGGLTLAGYAYLGARYWFRVPLTGIAVAGVAYVAGVVAGRM